MNVRFEKLRAEDIDDVLPRLFLILYENMTDILPTGCSYESDRGIWLKYITPRIEAEEVSILLMLVGDQIVGYFQYCLQGEILWAEEVEIKPEFQRSKLFYLFCCHMRDWKPTRVRYVKSYVHKDNQKSILIHEHLGMERIGENDKKTSWLYCGNALKMDACLRR